MKNNNVLYEPYQLGKLTLKNRFLMAPMTRTRALDYTPNEIMVKYYEQRSTAGLIITEGVAPSANGNGYIRMPGIYTNEQIAGWKKITDAVHDNDSTIFAQLMHTGRASHIDNMPKGGIIMAPSAIALSAEEKIWTDTDGLQSSSLPKEMTLEDIERTKNEFVQASLNSIEAGFDGVELHGANGYLLDQFLNPAANQRNDQYGGSIENRARFAIEVTTAIAKAIGKEKVGYRISPFGIFNSMIIYPEMIETFLYLVRELDKIGIVYVHIVDHSSMGSGEVSDELKKEIKHNFSGDIVAVKNYTVDTALNDINNGIIDLPAFGRSFLANPDLPYRLLNKIPLNEFDPSTLYAGKGRAGEEGYTDYPFAN